MTDNKRQFENFVRDIKFDDTPDVNHRDKLERQLLTAMAKQSPRHVNILRIIMKTKITKLAAASLIIIAVMVGIHNFGSSVNGTSAAFGQVLEQIEKAKTITWKTTFYTQVTSKDGKRTWIETETRQLAYKSPGLYREVCMDENMQIEYVTITDNVHMKLLGLNPGKKKATIRELALTQYDPRGPFVWVKEAMKEHDLEWVGKVKTTAGEVNVFRTAFRDKGNNEDWGYDFWIDEKTKQLVSLQVPGADIYDIEKDPNRKNPPEKEWSMEKPACFVQYDINFDTEIDESLFSLEPPEGYTFAIEGRPEVTEEEMFEYLRILAEYNDKIFPDRAETPSSDKINQILETPEQERTTAEQKLIETVKYYLRAGLNLMPIAHFRNDRTVKDSFRYLGKGVRLGDKDRIVCWYKLKDSHTYRVVYGDLSVKDVAPSDLPLKVEP